jgi:hypothetical protein
MSLLESLGVLMATLAVAVVIHLTTYALFSRLKHKKQHVDWQVSNCKYCAKHNPILWLDDYCNCARCRNIRQLEYDLEIGLEESS